MQYDSISERYAAALFEIAREKGALKEWGVMLREAAMSLKSHPFMGRALFSPRIPSDIKKEMLSKLFAAKLPKELLSFFYLLVDKGRERYLTAILNEYEEKCQELEGGVTAVVTVAVPLDPGEERNLASALSHFTGKKVRLEITVDTIVGGGALIRMGGKILDWTISGHLERLKKIMSQTVLRGRE
ncbi:MAG: ATP synthase F1 subunit delta [Vulcanimicrobiota bacterium]